MLKFFFIAFALVLLSITVPAFADSGCLNDGCHKKMLDSMFVHGPVAVGECGDCHSQTGKHTFKLAAAGDALCADCHDFKAKGVNCTKCHDPHGSDREYQLKTGAGAKCAI